MTAGDQGHLPAGCPANLSLSCSSLLPQAQLSASERAASLFSPSCWREKPTLHLPRKARQHPALEDGQAGACHAQPPSSADEPTSAQKICPEAWRVGWMQDGLGVWPAQGWPVSLRALPHLFRVMPEEAHTGGLPPLQFPRPSATSVTGAGCAVHGHLT